MKGKSLFKSEFISYSSVYNDQSLINSWKINYSSLFLAGKYYTRLIMRLSKSAGLLRDRIEKAIEDSKITRKEMDEIIAIVSEDGHVDPQEQSLLNLLQEMIENKEVKIVAWFAVFLNCNNSDRKTLRLCCQFSLLYKGRMVFPYTSFNTWARAA